MIFALLASAVLFSAISAGAESGSLEIGAGASVITPFLDEPMAGYYYPRSAEGVHDDLHSRALIIGHGSSRIVLVATSTVSVSREAVADARQRIHQQLGISPDRVLISATHSHTGPVLTPQYVKDLGPRIADSVKTASKRLTPARLYVVTEDEPSLPHYRRYFMKDGAVVTNPGFLNPNVVKPAGAIDPRVGVLYVESASGSPLATWVNYAMHLDTVGGALISEDYPHFLARTLARLKGSDMMSIFTIGAAGNINHWDVRRAGPQRGFDEARRLGEVLAAATLKAYTHLEPVQPSVPRAASTRVRFARPKFSPQEIEAAQKIMAQPPPPNVDFTLERVNAAKIVATAKAGSADIETELQVLAVGPVAFVGIPGELFVELGREIRRQSPFPHTFIVELANDSIGYIPTREAFAQGSYEPTSARMVPGSGELLVEKAVELLKRVGAGEKSRPL
jgi:neutral ceramidase